MAQVHLLYVYVYIRVSAIMKGTDSVVSLIHPDFSSPPFFLSSSLAEEKALVNASRDYRRGRSPFCNVTALQVYR